MFRKRSHPFTKQASRAARRPAAARLWLELLEDRCVPAGTLTGVPFTSLNPQPVEGTAFTGQVATVFDTGPNAPTLPIAINWGDGTPVDTTTGVATAIAGSPGAFAISGTHTFAEESSSVTPPFSTPVTVTVSDTANAIAAITINSQAAVLDANLSQGNTVKDTPSQTFFGGGAAQPPTAAALASFKAAIGGAVNTTAAPQTGGFRSITWDGVKTDGTDAAAGPNSTTVITPTTVGIPLNRFEGSGVYFGAVYAVSSDNFVSVNPSTAGLFTPFSPKNSFAMFNDNGIDFKFVVPGATSSTIVSASSRGFGAVFLNVEQPNTTSIQYFNGNVPLATEFAPVGGKGQASFVGALFNNPVVTRVVLTLGTDVLFKFDGTTTTPGPTADSGTNTGTNLVTTDDWAFAEPVKTLNGLPIVTGAQGTTNAALLPVSATATVPFTGIVGSFSDLDPNANAKDFTATINWGDGHSTNGTITKNALGGFDVSGTNTYAKEGQFAINIDVADFGGGNGSGGSLPVVSVNNTLTVADAPLTLTGTAVNATLFAPFTGQVATLKDADLKGNIGQFTATINWGDGTAPLTGTVAAATGNTFTVSGTHTFTKLGSFNVTVTIADSGNATATVNSTAVVTKAAQTIGGYEVTTSIFLLRSQNNQGAPDAGSAAFGTPGFLPILGDWNGDGVQTIGVFDPTTATWFLRNENNAGAPDAGQFQFGAPGDMPVSGDWAGIGHSGIGVFRPSTGQWLLRKEVSGGPADAGSFAFGPPGAIPVTGDWKGVGHTGIGVFVQATGTWLLRTEASGGNPDAGNFAFGGPNDTPVTGDWNASGHTGIGVYTRATFTFALRNEVSAGGPDAGVIPFGNPNVLPLAGTYALPGHLLLAPSVAAVAGVVPVSNAQLQATVAAALERLAAAGVDPKVLDGLATARFDLGMLPANVLGVTDVPGRHVTLSADASAQGWFVDPTPGQDEEFASSGGASAGSPAASKVDLLTTVLHEMGHLAGRPDVSSLGSPFDLMGDALPAGVRRTDALDQVFAAGL